MRRTEQIMQTIIAAFLLCSAMILGRQVPVRADSISAPSLIISQLKITSSNGQFVTLYNPTSAIQDMSKYQLEYFNSYDLSKATSSRLITLSGNLPPHAYYMINDSSQLICYQMTVDSVSLGFSTTAGMVEIVSNNQTSPGTPVITALQDYVGWSKTAAGGAQTLPSAPNGFLIRQPFDSSGNPKIDSSGNGNWITAQPDPANACGYTTSVASSGSQPLSTGLLLPGDEPPVSIVQDSAVGDGPSAGLPAMDIGLMKPTLTEIMPNPSGTGNDSTDEFIELYNPNNSVFDLSGFSLRTGTTTFHSYVFPSGTILNAKSFKAFYSDETHLSLSNTSGQAAILDPSGNLVSSSEPYNNASDGQTWSLAQGKWTWTTQPTPGSANIIHQPTKKSKTSKTTKAGSTALNSKKSRKSLVSANPSQISSQSTTSTPIHAWAIALVGGAALLYGAYEYRTDLANAVQQFGGYLRARRWYRA
jgi:hypothetical protein